jgi:signal transduction histidine kinase
MARASTEAQRTEVGAEVALQQGLLTATAALRWAAWVWMAVVVAIDLRNGPVAHPEAMVAAVAVTLVITAANTAAVRVAPAWLLSTPVLLSELAVGMTLLFADHWVYGPTSSHAQSLGSIWPLAGVFAIGIRFGAGGGLLAGLAIGASSWLGSLVFVPGRWFGDRILGTLGTIVLYALGGAIAGYAASKLRSAERQIATARAREEIARTLHDGVLQTLAVVQRRSTDTELVGLARDQELELRRYLFGDGRDLAVAGDELPHDATDVLAVLRVVAQRIERRDQLRVDVVATPDVPAGVDPAVVHALAGAVAESLTNAAKHGNAGHATVFVDLADTDPTASTAGTTREGVSCSVKDDGCGFGPEVAEGVGLTRSVRGRITDVGGHVTVDGRPGRGAEVQLWVPVVAQPPNGEARLGRTKTRAATKAKATP